MDETEQLSWEARAGRRVAPAAFIAPILLIGGSVYTTSKLGSIPNDATEVFLRRIHQHSGPFIGGAVASGIGIVLLIPVFLFFYRAIVARRPQIPKVALYLAVAGPIAAAALGIARQAEFVHAANKFVKHPEVAVTSTQRAHLAQIKDPQKYLDAAKDLSPRGHADNLLKSGGVKAVAEIGLVANVALGIAFLLIGMNAMRAGLFSRFMGILAVVIGVLTVLPIFDATILELFWLGAVGLLLLDRWPGGRRAPGFPPATAPNRTRSSRRRRRAAPWQLPSASVPPRSIRARRNASASGAVSRPRI
jgi:hypothetical protein